MSGLGKKRSRYGAYLDARKVDQEKIRAITGLGKDTLTRVCSTDHLPSGTTMRKLIEATRRVTGENVDTSDFWTF